MTATSEYLQEKIRRWAEQTREMYRCPMHQEPNPFCECVDVTGREVRGTILYDGRWEERSAEIQDARRRYHAWADQWRPEVQSAKAKFKEMIESKQKAVQDFKEWRQHCAASGFETIGHYANRRT